jgi:hypothetical protein
MCLPKFAITRRRTRTVVALSLRAWAPVFTSIEKALGLEINRRLHGEDWRTYQSAAVRAVLADPTMKIWVAEEERKLAGFGCRDHS